MLYPGFKLSSSSYPYAQADRKQSELVIFLDTALRCQSRRKNSSVTRCFLCQVPLLNLDRKLAQKAKMAKIGSNASFGLGNEY